MEMGSRRETNLEQFITALVGGELITLLIFAVCHKTLSILELIVFWTSVQMVSTFAVWELMVLIRERRTK